MQIIKSKNKNSLIEKHSKNVFPKLLSSQASKLVRGFSLIELIIVVAIMMTVTTAVLFRQSKFSSDILITNMAYEVALSVRQAAVFGLSSRVNSTVTNRSGYGVHFGQGIDSGSVGFGADEGFTNFIEVADEDGLFDYFYTYDIDNTDVYDGASRLTQGQTIKRYCGRTNSSEGWNCYPDDGEDLEMGIVYVKPNPEAHITMGSEGQYDATYNEAIIVVESALGDKCRTVYVSVSGQISIEPFDPDGCARGTE